MTEIRAALPLALTVFELNSGTAYLFTVLGNMIPIALIFLLLPPVIRISEKRFTYVHHLLENHFRRLAHKHKDRFQHYGALALVFFVMIPFPGSGVWTGSLLAILFDIKPQKAIPAIVAGLLAAGILVLLITNGVLGAWSFLL